MKLCQRRFRLYVTKRFFSHGAAGNRNRFPRKVVTVPRLTEFKKYLDSNLKRMVGFLGLSYAGPGVELQ